MKKSKAISSVLTGKYLIDGENRAQYWLSIFVLLLMVVIMINSSNIADKKINRISDLSDEILEEKSKFLVQKKNLNLQKRGDVIEKKANQLGLFKVDKPIDVIEVEISGE